MRQSIAIALAALALVGAAVGVRSMARPMNYGEFEERVPQPAARGPIISYGPDPLQHVELWGPAIKRPIGVVLMLHGGCWQTGVAKADIMHAAAADLAKRGFAVWNVEYRGVDVPGGGYPGTFHDVAAAADLLAQRGKALGVDTSKVVAVGHSAGAQLALWLAGRARISRSSILAGRPPLHLLSVVSVGGLPDLASARVDAAGACGTDTVDRLVGAPGAARRDVFADTSPTALLPLGIRIDQVSGAQDPIAPPRFAEAFAAKARAHDPVTTTVVPGAGHFELIAPGTAA